MGNRPTRVISSSWDNNNRVNMEENRKDTIQGLDEAANLAKNVQMQIDNIVVGAGTSPVEVQQARIDKNNVAYTTLDARLEAWEDKQEKTASKAENIEAEALNITQDAGPFWNPGTQPAMPWGYNGTPTDRNPEKFINAMYEPLRTANPNYITRTNLGMDSTNTWNVYRYELTPKNFSKTIILTAGTHGNEYSASFFLARFINILVNEWKNSTHLSYIRKNVRLIIMPIINPYGFFHSKRQNGNGVDLNRNTDYLWEYITSSKFQIGGTYYKGPSPFSEKETQYFRRTMQDYSDALASIDYHTIITVAAEHIVYTPRYMSQHRRIFNDVIDWLYKQGNRIVNGTSAVPTLSCWAGYNYGMTVANPEWCNGLYGTETRGSVEMTEIVKYFGNVAIQACTLTSKGAVLDTKEPDIDVLVYEKSASNNIKFDPANDTSISYNNYGNVKHAVFDKLIRRHGIWECKTRVTFTLSAPATVSLNPVLYQSYHPEMSWTKTKDANTFENKQTYAAAGQYTMYLDSVMNVFPTNYNETGAGETQRTAEAKWRLRAKLSAGNITIDSFRTILKYTSTDVAKPVKYRDYTGLEAQPEGSDYKTTYPDPAKFDYDTDSEE